MSLGQLAQSGTKRLREIKLKTLLIMCIALMSFVFVVNLVSTSFSYNLTSDNVSVQYIVQSAQGTQGGRGVFPADSYIIHTPLYLLTDLVIHGNTRGKLLLQALVLGTGFLAGVIVSFIYYLKWVGLYNRRALLMGTLVLSFILSTQLFAEYVLMINHRPLEVGISLLLLLPMHIFLTAKRIDLNPKNICLGLLYALGLGLLWFDDPYFLYVMTGGAAFTMFMLWVIKRISLRTITLAAGIFGIGYLFTKLGASLFERLGITLVPNGNTTLVSADSLVVNIQNSLQGFLINFNGNLLGVDMLNIGKSKLISLVAGLTLAGVAILALVHSAKRLLKEPRAIRILYFSSSLTLILLVGLTQTATLSIGIRERYFILLPVLLAPLIVEYMVRVYRSNYYRLVHTFVTILCIGLVVLVGTNMHSMLPIITHNKKPSSNTLNYGLIATIESSGYTKGYANYWQASINTYLSNEHLHVLPTVCNNGSITAYHWLVNDSDFDIKANKSFYIVDPDLADFQLLDSSVIDAVNACSIQNLTRQYGKPEKILTYAGRSVLLYNYDLLGSGSRN